MVAQDSDREAVLAGRVYVVTGGAGALGGAVASRLAARGAVVRTLDRVAPRQDPASGAATSGTIAHAIVDLADERAVAAAYASLERLDGSIHCAGGFDMKPAIETTLADMEAMWRMNAVSCFLCCREALRTVRRSAPHETHGGAGRSGDRSGAEARRAEWPRGWIVNVAARPAITPAAGMLAYSVSKAAVASITMSLAAEAIAEGILVNAVVPSIMDTPSNRASMPTADHAKWPSVRDVAEVIRSLASPSNRVTSGALVPVYGAA